MPGSRTPAPSTPKRRSRTLSQEERELVADALDEFATQLVRGHQAVEEDGGRDALVARVVTKQAEQGRKLAQEVRQGSVSVSWTDATSS